MLEGSWLAVLDSARTVTKSRVSNMYGMSVCTMYSVYSVYIYSGVGQEQPKSSNRKSQDNRKQPIYRITYNVYST